MPLDDDQFRAIGRINFHFNELELFVNMMVWGLVNPKTGIGRTAFAGESFDRMLGKLRRSSEYVGDEKRNIRSAIQWWAPRAKDVQRRRNEVLHALWFESNPAGELFSLLRTGKETEGGGIGTTELVQLAEDIIAVCREALIIMRSIPGWINHHSTASFTDNRGRSVILRAVGSARTEVRGCFLSSRGCDYQNTLSADRLG
jgi:hypothetical protein